MTTCLDGYANLPRSRYLIIFPLNLGGLWLSRRRWLKVDGHRFKVLSWAQVRQFTEWSKFLEKASQYPTTHSHLKIFQTPNLFTPLLAEAEARSPEEAFESANKRFDALRAVINLEITGFTRTVFPWVPELPLGRCKPPPVYPIFDGSRTFKTFYSSIEGFRYQSNQIQPKQGEQVRKRLRRIDTVSTGMKELLLDCLSLYSEAFDSFQWRSVFLNLWQILEIAAGAGGAERPKFDKIARRIQILTGFAEDEAFGALLRDFVETRHKLVHEGKFSQQGESVIELLKVTASIVIIKLAFLGKIKRFDSQDLLEFFHAFDVNDVTLKRRQRIIGHILNLRP